MKSILAILAVAALVGGCSFIPPTAPTPDEAHLVPVNATEPAALRGL